MRAESTARSTRRAVVATGAKIAYATPLVAATFSLGAGGVAAGCACPEGTVEVRRPTSAHLGECVTCPPGYAFQVGQEDCKQGPRRVAATFGAKTCISQ